jgi:hypothetical protein
MPRKPGTPSLRRHKPSGQGVVTLSGKDVYLGVWPADQEEPPAAVRARYHLEVAEWEARGRLPSRPAPPPVASGGSPARPAVAELILAYMRHAEGYYRDPAGKPTSEVNEYALSLRPLNHLYGALAVDDFGPLKLKTVRELMVSGYQHPRHGEQAALCRSLINKRMRRIVAVFRWGVAEEVVAESTWQALKSVAGLKKGRTRARETDPVGPVPAKLVEETLPYLNAHVQGVVRFMLHTGARPGEACAIRLAEIDRAAAVWLYRPTHHKTAHKDKGRVVAIGRKGQGVLREFIKIKCSLCGVEGRPRRIGSPDGCLCGPCSDRQEEQGVCGPWQRIEAHPERDYLFSPAEAMRERNEDRRAQRKSKVQPSQACRKKARPRKQPRLPSPASASPAASTAAAKRPASSNGTHTSSATRTQPKCEGFTGWRRARSSWATAPLT